MKEVLILHRENELLMPSQKHTYHGITTTETLDSCRGLKTKGERALRQH